MRRPRHACVYEKGLCWTCSVWWLLRNVEGFHEEVVDVTREADAADDSGGPTGSERVARAVEGAAARGFLLGLEAANRPDLKRLWERAWADYLGRLP